MAINFSASFAACLAAGLKVPRQIMYCIAQGKNRFFSQVALLSRMWRLVVFPDSTSTSGLHVWGVGNFTYISLVLGSSWIYLVISFCFKMHVILLKSLFFPVILVFCQEYHLILQATVWFKTYTCNCCCVHDAVVVVFFISVSKLWFCMILPS